MSYKSAEVLRLKRLVHIEVLIFFYYFFFQIPGREPKRAGKNSNGCHHFKLLVKINALYDPFGHVILTFVSHMYLQNTVR